MRAPAWVVASASVPLLLWAAWPNVGNLRHVAVPVFGSIEYPLTRASQLSTTDTCSVLERRTVDARISALAKTPDGTVWVGTFDAGLYRLPPMSRAPQRLPNLSGRELFVNAIAIVNDEVWVATAATVIRFDLLGIRLPGRAPPIGVEDLLVTGDRVYGATAKGLVRWDGSASPVLVQVSSPGQTVRLTTLAATEDILWMGSPTGVYSIPMAHVESTREPIQPRWHPLMFGPDAADTNVVTALASAAGGVWVGTDNGGLVWVPSSGDATRAFRFRNLRANEVNLKAAVSADGAVLFGTQGGGMLRVREPTSPIRREGSRETLDVTALWARSGTFLAGTSSGTILRLECSPGLAGN